MSTGDKIAEPLSDQELERWIQDARFAPHIINLERKIATLRELQNLRAEIARLRASQQGTVPICSRCYLFENGKHVAGMKSDGVSWAQCTTQDCPIKKAANESI